MTSAVACAHDWIRDARHGSSTNVTLTCRRCGATSVSTGSQRGRAVTVTLDLYPPHGASVLAPELYDFFLRQWEAHCQALAAAGYSVARRPPVIHSTASITPAGSTGRPAGEDRTRYGVAFAVGIAVTLIGGIAMLVAGLSLHLPWLSVAGGVTLGVLALLVLVVVLLSS